MQKSELECDFCVNLPAREIVGNGILLVGYVGNPVVRVHVVDAEQVESVNAEPDVAEDALLLLLLLVVQQPVAHADVDALVGGHAVGRVVEAAMGSAEGQTVGKCQFERHFPPVGTGEEVGEEQVH